MIIAVDFDETLALGNCSHITLLKPNTELISRLQRLRKSVKPYIKIVTARGAKAGLTTEAKQARYLSLLQDFLKKYNVPYDEISFNKEYANLYIDDMAISPYEDFTGETSYFTQNKILFTDKTVIKHCPTALFEFDWYKKAPFNTPKVLFCNDELIVLERLRHEGKPKAFEFIELIEQMKGMKGEGYSFETYLNNLPQLGIEPKVEAHEDSFFHGDLSTSNVLMVNSRPYLIDPNHKHVFGSWLTDAGKAVFSLIAYENNYQEAKKIVDHFGKQVNSFAVTEGLRVCKYRPEYLAIVKQLNVSTR